MRQQALGTGEGVGRAAWRVNPHPLVGSAHARAVARIQVIRPVVCLRANPIDFAAPHPRVRLSHDRSPRGPRAGEPHENGPYLITWSAVHRHASGVRTQARRRIAMRSVPDNRANSIPARQRAGGTSEKVRRVW